ITTSNKPINEPNDLKGMKLRVPVSPLFTSMFRALGTSPTAINFVEVYTALQTKIVDGQENPLALIDAAKFYEVQKYCSLTGRLEDAGALQRRAVLTSRVSCRTVPSKARRRSRRHRGSRHLSGSGRSSRPWGSRSRLPPPRYCCSRSGCCSSA